MVSIFKIQIFRTVSANANLNRLNSVQDSIQQMMKVKLYLDATKVLFLMHLLWMEEKP